VQLAYDDNTDPNEREPMADEGFSTEERAAMKERAKELKAAKNKEDSEKEVLKKFAEMTPADRVIGESLHKLVMSTAPDLLPKNWYGQPAYYLDGKVIVFFQSAGKFKTRYSSLGFSEDAKLDDGVIWPTSFALLEWTPAVEKQVAALVKKAVG